MWDIVGHEKQVKFLAKGIEKHRLAHAYLFVGPGGVGKLTVALAFAKALNCQRRKDGTFCGQCKSCLTIDQASHPDVHLISPESDKSGEISIAQIKKLCRDFTLSALSGFYKVGIIDGADILGLPAANAFLKTLEEPLGKTTFILTSASGQILPTISSRCQILKFPSLSILKVEEYLKAQGVAQAKKIARISMGRPGLALSAVKNPEILKKQENLIDDLISLLTAGVAYRFKYVEAISREMVKDVLSCWILFFRDILISGYNCSDLAVFSQRAAKIKNFSRARIIDIIKTIKRTYEIITSTNVNHRLALEVMMLDL